MSFNGLTLTFDSRPSIQIQAKISRLHEKKSSEKDAELVVKLNSWVAFVATAARAETRLRRTRSRDREWIEPDSKVAIACL